MRDRLRWPLLGPVLLLALCAALPAQAEAPQPPPYYAIQDVRVVTGTGKVLEGATVLIADGLIEAVGTNVRVPADAWVLEGEGLTVYPGLVDAMSKLGQKEPEDSDDGDDDTLPRGPQDRPHTWPWLAVADELVADEKADKWREAGFTSVVSVPQDGIFAGQAAFLNLTVGDPGEWVVATPVAQTLTWKRGGWRSYPGSLMGVLAYVRQVLEDARHYEAVMADYGKNPEGMLRPAHDRNLQPLLDAIEDGLPFLMPGDLGRQLDRALRLAAEYDLKPILYGAQGAYTRADVLAEAGAAVLVSVDWPEAKKDRDPDLDTPLRTMIHRRLAPTTPAALADAEVPFAFISDGLGSASDVFEGVRTAVENGLAPEDAMMALSAWPAEIFGVADRVGTVERGKIANLVLASDWPWAEGVEVSAVFVDGHRFAEREDDEPQDPPASDVSGEWAITMDTPRGSREMTAELEMDEDGKVTGKIVSEMGDTNVDDGRMSADLLRFETTREFGGRQMTATWSLTVEGESLTGSMNAGPMAMDVKGSRTSKPAEGGEEEEASDEAEEIVVTPEELKAALARVQGKVAEMDHFAVTNAEIWTVSGETIPNGTVVVKDGKIVAVGEDVEVPGGADVIDAQGGALIPGIIDCHSHLGIEGGVNEGSLAVTAMVGIEDVVNPDDIAIYRALAGGVTAANLLHGSANPIGGRNQVIKFRWGVGAEAMKMQGAPPGIKFALGENPKRSNVSGDFPQRYPQSRMGVMDVIRQAFVEAQTYQKAWEDWEKGRKESGFKVPRPKRDLKLEALVEILEGERLVHSHCYRADEILQLMRLAEEFGFRIATFQHVLEGYKVADEIAAHGAGGSTFSDWWGFKIEAYDAIPYNAAIMTERGVVVSINSDSSEEIRHLNQEAAKCVRWGGMDEVDALALVTLNPAKQLGIDDRVGSIEVGKDADLVLYDGHPLEIRSVVQKTWIDGDLYFDLEADRERQAFLEEMKAKLDPKDDDDEGKEDGGNGGREIFWADDHYSCREDH